MSTWKELGSGFRNLESALQFSRLDIQWGSSGEHFRIAAANDRDAERRFEALSRSAGEMLAKFFSSDVAFADVLAEHDPKHRWYSELVLENRTG